MVAGQLLLEAMLDEPSCALRTFEAVTARSAERQRRISTAIQKQQRLLAFFERLGHRRDEALATAICPASSFSERKIDRRHVRHVDARKAARQDGVAIAPDQRVDVAFDRRRCGGEDDGELAEVAAHDGHVAALGSGRDHPA